MGSNRPSVRTCRVLDSEGLETLLGRFGVEVCRVAEGAEIPGSYWGAPEAGIVGKRLYVRPDTPVHSALHEGCHLVCAGAEGRGGLDTDAGGSYAEEDAVCYLQILLADALPGMGAERMMEDMDAWGYTFRLGSAKAWFDGDAEDAREWLRERGLVDAATVKS